MPNMQSVNARTSDAHGNFNFEDPHRLHTVVRIDASLISGPQSRMSAIVEPSVWQVEGYSSPPAHDKEAKLRAREDVPHLPTPQCACICGGGLTGWLWGYS